MKYSEFLQFRELLEQTGITLEEFKKDPKLYEAGLLGKIGTSLWNLAKKGMQKAVSAGLEPTYKEKLNKKAEEIKNWVVNDIEDAEDNEEHILHQFFVKRDPQGDTILDKHIARYINKNVDRMLSKAERSISKMKGLDDDAKENVSDYWEELGIQIKLGVAMSLQNKNIISDDSMEELINALKGTKKRGTPPPPPPPSS